MKFEDLMQYKDLREKPTAEVLGKLPFGKFVELVSTSTGIQEDKQLLTIQDVMAVTKMGRSRIYSLMERGDFPRCQRDSGGKGRRALWQAAKVYEWCSR